jgi:GNAT superfamily N-acetyltransferase
MLGRLADLWRAYRRSRALPWVEVALTGDLGRELHRQFTRSHRRWLIIPQKVYGVALMRLPPAPGQVLQGGHRQALRTNRSRALRAGYQVRPFDPLADRQAIDAIYASLPSRQGKAMQVDAAEDLRLANLHRDCYLGVYGPDGALAAFSCCPTSGELAVYRSFVGHRDHRRQGIMYLLHAAVVDRLAGGGPAWLMYEGYLGQTRGMQYFLDRCGFAPVNVRWRLAPSAATAQARASASR